MSLLRFAAGRAGHGGPAIPGDMPNALLQAFLDGDYDGGHSKVYGTTSGFPHQGTDLLLIDETLDTPAVGTVVSPTEIILAPIIGAVVLAESLADKQKYRVISKSDNTGTIISSIGTASDDFTPDIIVSTMAWYPDDTVDFDGSRIKVIPDVLAQYAGEVSTTSPETDGDYTTAFQAQDADDVAVHRIDLTLTVSVVGSGGGSAAEPTVVTDRYGASETIHNTAGDAGAAEPTHVTDGTNTGNGPSVTPIASNRTLTFTSLDNGGGTGSNVVSDVISVPAGASLVVRLIDIHHNAPTLGDAGGVVLGSQPFAFDEDAHIHGDNGGDLSIYSSGVLAAQFDGTVLFTAGGAQLAFALTKAVPNAACSAIQVVPTNTVTMHEELAGLTLASMSYPNTITDSHNALLAAFANYSPRTATKRANWTETDDLDSGAQWGLQCQHKTGADTAAEATFLTPAPLLLLGAAVEYEALP